MAFKASEFAKKCKRHELFILRPIFLKEKYFCVATRLGVIKEKKNFVFHVSSLQSSALFMGFQSKLIVAGLPGDVVTFDNHLYVHFDGFLV